jgi:formylglycine-generating enzyme required for sulfatase activity
MFAADPPETLATFRDFAGAPEMVALPAGAFIMGSTAKDPHADSFEHPQHEVQIGYRFALGRYPVTFDEWDACVADGGASHKRKDLGWGRGSRPVINVTWQECQLYATWLNRKAGIDMGSPFRYRLPSESEWEYACRAGSQGRYSTPSGRISEQDATYDADWADDDLSPALGQRHRCTTPVGLYAPNAWRLHDMHGNVHEWVQDSLSESYQVAPRDGRAHEGNESMRVFRGGSWASIAKYLRTAARDGNPPDTRNRYVGFRVARTLPPMGS